MFSLTIYNKQFLHENIYHLASETQPPQSFAFSLWFLQVIQHLIAGLVQYDQQKILLSYQQKSTSKNFKVTDAGFINIQVAEKSVQNKEGN